MNRVMHLFIFSILVFIVSAWKAPELTDNTKPHPGYCYSDKEGVGAMEKGEIKTRPGHCVQVFCKEGGWISYAGCRFRVPAPGYILLPSDFSKPYPMCCPQITPEPSVASAYQPVRKQQS